MLGLFKKKEDPSASNNNQSNSSKQRPPPPSNGLHGSNNSSNNHGNTSGSPLTGSMSPTGYSQQQQQYQQQQQQQPLQLNNPNLVQTQASFLPYTAGGLPSPQVHSAAPLQAATGSMLPTPQLYWTQRRILGTNPFPRFQHTSSVITNGTDIYLYGGSQDGNTKGDLFIIDSTSLECQLINAAGDEPSLPKSGHSAVNIGQYLIYFGGQNATTGQCDGTLHVLHTGRKEWNKPPIQGPLPTPRHSHTAVSIGTIMYIFGGQNNDFYMDDINAFDMMTITQNPRWEKLEPQTESPPARSGHCACAHEGKIYVFGGADVDYFYNDIWCFDPKALTWTPIPASGYLPTGRHGHSCTVVDGIMYIFGGNSPDGSELNDAYAFKIHERRWYLFQNVGTIASARSGHTMCTVKDRIYVLGGASEQTKLEDSALIYYLEISKIRYPDLPQMIPPRQASSQRLLMSSPPPDSVHSDSDRNSGQNQHQQQQRGPPERPDRPDRRTTQRPTSPPMFSPSDRKGSFSNPTISQHTNQLMNSQMGQHPMTSFASPPPPPPRGISAGAGFSPANSANVGPNDYQAEGLSVATRRQTLRDDFQGGYGGAVIGTASPINSPIASRRAIHPIPSSPSMGASPSPLRVINVSPTSPPPSSRSFSDIGADDTTSPISARPNKDHHSMDFVPPPGTGKGPVEDINPYAMEAITPGSTMSPMVQSPSSTASPSAYIPPPPLMTSFSAAVSGSEGQNIIANSSPRSPLSGVNSHLPPSTSAVPGSDRKPGQPAQASTPIPGPLNDRSASPIAGKNMTTRGSGGSAFALGLGTDGSSTPVVTSVPEKSARRVSVQQQQQQQEVMKMSRVVQSENEMLKQEVEKLRKREQWLMAEVILTRDSLPAPTSGHGKKQEGNDDPSSLSLQEKRLSMVDLERELASGELEGQQLKIMKALVKVKEELKTAKMSIVTQAQTASNKIKEAERVRTAALQEAAYLKAKMSSMTNAQQDPGALARVEMERAADLEKRLTNALNELDAMEIQYQKAQETLEQEKRSRIAAEERSQGSILLADQAQSAHTRALAEITSLHSRASKAEAESREYAAQLAETQAGVSGHQSQSSGLLQKVQSLKQQVEEQELALERAQVAFSVANDRAARAEARSEEAAQKIDRLESQRFELSTEANRYKSEAERLQSKVEDLENRWQVSKDEVATLRKLVEDGLGAFSPRARSEKITPERKHDSIAILSTVSRVSELEHELASLKKLHSVSQAAATKSSSELADAMIELSRLEQASMQARTETISLQKLLSHEREAAAQLRSNLVKTEQQLEEKVKELEDHEVQLGLLQDVMREKGMIAEDIVVHARARGTPEYAIELEGKVRAAQERIEELEQELKEVRSRFNEQSVVLENQRQNANQQAEKMSILLRKIKKDLEETIKEKEEVEIVFKQLQEDHAHCDDHVQELSTSCENLKEQEEERMMMLKMHWEEEHQELSGQINDLQKKLEESEMQSSELSQKAISATERLQEVEALNEAISDELENLQGQMESMKKKAAKTEEQLKADVERLVTEIHQTQEKLHAKQSEFNEASELNEQLQRELEQALQAQNQSQNTNQGSTAAIQRLESERQDLEQRLKKAQEEIHILEGDNSVLEARLADAEKKVALLLEDMQSSMTDVSNSPPSSDNLAGIHQQLTNHLRLNLSNLNSQTTSGSASSSPSILKNQHHQQSSPVLTNAQRLINNARSASQGSRSSQGSHSNSPVSQNATTTLSPLGSPTSKIYHATKTILNRTKYSNQNSTIGTIGTIGKQQTPHVGEYDAGEHVKPSEHQQRDLDRDSVDSITRELEMLKVPWNKNTPAFMQQQQQQQQQQQVPQTYQYSGKLNDHKNQFYNYSDESSEGDNEEEYLAHMKQQQEQQQQHFKDTRSFNEKSTLRLKEYEQMIDEIENSRLH